jgi:hypothetical protein
METTILPVAAHSQPLRTAPEYIRLPRPGTRCPFTGMSRSALNNLILPCELNGYKPPVRSVSLRRRGAVRGTRLIDYQSLMDYIKSQEFSVQHAA